MPSVSLYLTDEEFGAVLKEANKRKMTPSAFLRQLVGMELRTAKSLSSMGSMEDATPRLWRGKS